MAQVKTNKVYLANGDCTICKEFKNDLKDEKNACFYCKNHDLFFIKKGTSWAIMRDIRKY